MVEELTLLLAVLALLGLAELVQGLYGFPDTEEGWSRLRVFAIATWARETTQEQVEDTQRAEARLLRRGVEQVRVASPAGPGGVGHD